MADARLGAERPGRLCLSGRDTAGSATRTGRDVSPHGSSNGARRCRAVPGPSRQLIWRDRMELPITSRAIELRALPVSVAAPIVVSKGTKCSAVGCAVAAPGAPSR